ncbi:RNA-binding motif protein 25 isoform X1 [Oryza sativa Japonica Group]|uniref:RNA-binding region RNP-1 and Splicing factor PWI family member protein n=4 Tax=Oryza sativa subsp. japonica TaxID=39947 RepID=Q6ZA70_ORYSJ|nr:RNA-binding protein 25 isoform X1 [Oryza sativa Japonica Group]BAC98582.1 putative RNA-binding region RNP-1 and Splicing factor PWI family member protein [Oryza sativa Japonica Group]
MAAVAPPPDGLDPPPATPPTAAAGTPPLAVPATNTPPNPATTPTPLTPNPNPSPTLPPPPMSTPPVVAPPMHSFAPSFRPLGAPPPPPPPQQVQVQVPPQYGGVPNPGYPMAQQMQPPGVPHVMPPGAVRPPAMYAPQPGVYLQQPGAALPPGMPRYPGPYPMMRPGFPPRPMPPVGVMPLQRPPIIPGIRGAPPVVPPTARPPTPAVTPPDKPPTAVYVGKIAPTVDNEFLLSLLRLCGPVKSWKRTQNPSSGKPVSFGFCEFESAEGILRATRLLNKLSIDGQELVVNINDATKEYLKKHVEEKKKAQEKTKEMEDGGGSGTTAVTGNELSKPVSDETETGTGDAGDKGNEENPKKFGIVTEEDSKADKDVAEKISSMIEEWLKTRPPPPPPPVEQSADISSKHKNGEYSVDVTKNDSEDKSGTGSDKRAVNETERIETGSPDKRKERERDKEKRDKDKELERHERERERERVRRDREKDIKYKEVERLYKERLKEWEFREREKEYQRQHEKEREKDRERERKREIMKQEDDSDEEDNRKRRRRSSGTLEERKRRRLREKEEDLADKLREEEEIAEARRRAVELQQQADEAAAAAAAAAVVAESATVMEVDGDDGKERDAQDKPAVVDVGNNDAFANGVDSGVNNGKDNIGDDKNMTPGEISDTKHNTSAPAKKLGFGLIGSGKRTSVPSVFAEEDDEDNDDKRARPLVPIDYSTEELQAVQANSSTGQPNIVAAAEFAKRILVTKDDKSDVEKDRSWRSSDRTNQRDRDRNDQDVGRTSDERREKTHDREKDKQDKPKSENKNILDAKQLIDMIPRTKEELFAYDINWAIYDKHELHERMRPWIAKKIIEFLGEEESTLVDYIVSCTKDHVQASKMLELLQSILDVEAEMFVLKMWRMLIFEIKKVETGLSGRAKA